MFRLQVSGGIVIVTDNEDAEMGSSNGLNQVVKTTVFLADMDDFTAMNEVYGRFFSEEPPARATVQAARLPRDARVEIEAIAVVIRDRE